MKEFVLHYIWQHKLFVQHELISTDGQKIEVIDVGKPNIHEGPDFFNAKIRIGNTIWAGNVEIHNFASDWNKHRHQSNKNYQNVILHVVKKADVPVFLTDGQKIPQLELTYADEIERNYEALHSNTKWIACEDKLCDVPDIIISEWKSALISERLEQKVKEIDDLLMMNDNNWEETLYLVLCKYFGFSVNNEAFLSLAKSIPWVVILKNCDEIFKLEALLFGQAGLLESFDCNDEYIRNLTSEYEFFRRKYNLQPMDSSKWRLLRLRPDNFPYIRLAQLASLLSAEQKMFSKLINGTDIKSIVDIFKNVSVSEYWTTHYTPKNKSTSRSKRIGESSIFSLIINVIVPMLFCYGEKTQNQNLKDRAMIFLDNLPPENNYIIRNWNNTGVKIENASDTQSLIYLYKNYCEKKDCLRCRIGFKVLTKSI